MGKKDGACVFGPVAGHVGCLPGFNDEKMCASCDESAVACMHAAPSGVEVETCRGSDFHSLAGYRFPNLCSPVLCAASSRNWDRHVVRLAK